jgi:hypothetical protein
MHAVGARCRGYACLVWRQAAGVVHALLVMMMVIMHDSCVEVLRMPAGCLIEFCLAL